MKKFQRRPYPVYVEQFDEDNYLDKHWSMYIEVFRGDHYINNVLLGIRKMIFDGDYIIFDNLGNMPIGRIDREYFHREYEEIAS